MVSQQQKWIMKTVFLYFILIVEVRAAPEADIIFSNKDDIRRFTYGSKTYLPVLGGLNDVRSIGYDYEEKRLFFITLQDLEKTLIKSKILGIDGTTQVVVDSGETAENDLQVLAVDWVTKKLYFTDMESNRVEVTNYDGSCRRVLVSTGLDQPRGIALFPQKGIMFVVDWGDAKKVERFNMDGSDRKVLIKTNDGCPYSVSVDYQTSTVYWGDSLKNTIESMTIDGKNRTVYKLGKLSPNYMTISQDRIFWSGTAGIYSFLKSNSFNISSVTQFDNNNIQPYDLRVFSQYRQPPVSSQCSVNNGGCSHLCLLRPGGITCACSTGIALKEDNKTCEKGMKKFLVIASRRNIRLMSLDVDKTVDFRLNVDKNYTKNVYGVTYDVEKQRVYWADSGCMDAYKDGLGNSAQRCTDPGSINSIFLNGTGYKKFISIDVKTPDHLAIDWMSRNLYWTDASLTRIEVARLDGSSRKIIISDNLQQPRGITLDPNDGKIYWTDWGNGSKIERSDLNGDHREELVTKNVKWPNGITIDLQGRKLYWVDPGHKAVFRYDLHSKEVTEISEASHPFGITVLGDYIYWTDWYRKVMVFPIKGVAKKEKGRTEVLLHEIADVMGICSVDANADYGTNDCNYKTNNCSHLCFHKPKIGAVCECPTNMELRNDEKTCYLPTGFLLYSNAKSIKKTSIDTYKVSHRLPFSETNFVDCIDIEYRSGRIVWYNSDLNPDKSGIYTAYLNGSGFALVASVDASLGLSIDWMSGNLYWTNKQANHIEVSRLDGSHRKVLIYGKKLISPENVLVNPHVRKLYWFVAINHDSNLKSFWVANLDGSEQKQLSRNLNPIIPNCAISYKTEKVYCCNKNQSIYSIISIDTLTGNVIILRENTPVLGSMVVFKDQLIYVDDSRGEILSLSISLIQTQEPIVLLETNDKFLYSIKTYHPDMQTNSNVCSQNNGGCQQLCFAATSTKAICSCETHFILATDGKTCQEPQNFLIANLQNSMLRFLYTGLDHLDAIPEAIIPVTDVKGVKSIDFDEIRNYIYWLHPATKQVIRAHQNGKDFEIINLVQPKDRHSEGILPYDFALEPFSNSLYWTDEKRNTINYLHLDSNANGTVFENAGVYPRKIVSYPEENLLFWTSSDTHSRKSVIFSTLIAGTEQKMLIELDRKSFLDDITIDFVQKRLYYLDTGLNQIGSITFEGQNNQVLTVSATASPSSIAVHGKYIFWADTIAIYKANKTQNSIKENMFHGKYEGLGDLVAVNLTRSKEKHPCMLNNGGCSHICRKEYLTSLSTQESEAFAMCGCPIGQNLDVGKKNCSTSEECKVDQVFCKTDSKCIPHILQCDGKEDCSDGEDENHPICKDAYIKAPCDKNKDLLRCGDTLKCVHKKNWCNKSPDCPSGEDEDKVKCARCKPSEFRCGILCLQLKQKCDGSSDCYDGSDEKDCPKIPHTTLSTKVISTQVPKKSRMVAGIVSGVIICVICLMFGILVYFKIRNSKKNASIETTSISGVWALAETELKSSLSTSDDHAKGSVSTYISAMSNDQSYYDRNNVTGQSDLSEFSQFMNPPPSPVTERAMSTISECNNGGAYYSSSHCEQCHRNVISEETMGIGGHDAPPPTLVSTNLSNDVEMYYLIQQPDWNQQKTVCDDCQSTSRVSNNGRMNGRMPHSKNRRGRHDSRGNGHLRSTHESISELEPLNSSWMYNSQDTNLDTHYGEEPLFIDSNLIGHHPMMDPPPSPCTYLYEDDRPPSPANTEQSIAFSVLHGMEHYAPPPSPTSQLL